MGWSSELEPKHQAATQDIIVNADTTAKRRRTTEFVPNPGVAMAKSTICHLPLSGVLRVGASNMLQ